MLSNRWMGIRDAGNCGLEYMDDPKSIPCLREAVEKETDMAWKRIWQMTLDQLEETAERFSRLASGLKRGSNEFNTM